MASRSEYLQYAQTAADVLTANWFGPEGPSIWVNQYPDFWRAPNAIIALARLMEATGRASYMDQAHNGQEAFVYWNRPDDGYPLWYTDTAWWANAFMYVHKFVMGFGMDAWAEQASGIYLDVMGGWDGVLNGGIWMQRNPRSYPQNAKGSISTLLAMDIVGRFAYNFSGGTPPPEWYQNSMTSWNWLNQMQLVNGAGMWYETLDGFGDPAGPPDLLAQALSMGAMVSLFPHTPDVWAVQQAQSYANATLGQFTAPDGILRSLCEYQGNCTTADNDPALYKGIFMRYLGELLQWMQMTYVPDSTGLAIAVRNNADALWANYPGRVYGMSWGAYSPNYQPTGDLLWDASLQVSALDLFLSAAAVSE